jgi:hypothetical protein
MVDPTEPVAIADQYANDDDDDDDYLPAPPPRRRIPPVTAGLLVAIVATGAFFGGVEVQKTAGKPKANTAAAALATAGATGNGASAASGTGAGGFGGGGSGGGGGFGGGARGGGRTAGLVTNVQPGVILITDAQGNVVKISTTGNPSVSKTTPALLTDVQIGATIVVQGQPASDGTINATAITVGSATGAGGGAGGAGGGGGG